MNVAVTGEHQETDPRKMLQHGLPVWSGPGEQREHACYCLVTLPAFHIYEQGSTCGWARERTDFPSTTPSVFGKARVQWTLHFCQACPSLLVNAFHWRSISGKKPWTGLEDQAGSFSVLQAPEAGEHVPPHHFAGAFLGAGPQQSRVSTVMLKIFKIHFWRHHLTKDTWLFWSYHQKPADQCQTVWWTTYISFTHKGIPI